jgi:hypothetical protein
MRGISGPPVAEEAMMDVSSQVRLLGISREIGKALMRAYFPKEGPLVVAPAMAQHCRR